MKAYVLLKPNRMIFSCGLQVDQQKIYKTCLIGFKSPMIAQNVRVKLEDAIKEDITVGIVDTEDASFVTMVRLNNLAVLLAEKYTDEGSELGFVGNLDATDYGIDQDNATYLDVIYKNY
jgi:hypothetical protein